MNAMRVRGITPILNVTDVPGSILWFEKLGWHRSFAWNAGGMIRHGKLEDEHGAAHFGGVCANSADEGDGPMIFLCKDAQGMRDPDTQPDPGRDDYGGVWMSWWVDDVDAVHDECVRSGVQVVRPPTDKPWGVREFLIRHPDGHYFRISGRVAEGL